MVWPGEPSGGCVVFHVYTSTSADEGENASGLPGLRVWIENAEDAEPSTGLRTRDATDFQPVCAAPVRSTAPVARLGVESKGGSFPTRDTATVEAALAGVAEAMLLCGLAPTVT